LQRRGVFRAIGLAIAALAALLPAPAARVQPLPASLVADRVTFDRETGLLVASGDVEVLFEGRVLRATRITYDRDADEIRAEGPIVLTDPAGGVLLADAAALSPDLEAGLIAGARLLIAGRLQLAAVELRRSEGRYTTLYRTVASSCTICAGDPTPTWALRAARVTRDEVARRIYFRDARLELFGLPVAWLPRLSIPDPAVERASGVLVPELVQSDIYGLGFKLPYYQVLGPTADATVTPFVTTTGAVLFEGEYRRRFAAGGFDISGVIALDDGLGGRPGRGVLSAIGAFDLRQGFVGDFDLNVVSDDEFLTQFDYSDADQLTSIARLHRTRPQDYFELDTIAFQSLRDDEETDTIPFVFPEFSYRRLGSAPVLGGLLGLEANALGIRREMGRDMLRGGAGFDWRRDWTLPRGVLAAAEAVADVNVYRVWDDPEDEDGMRWRGAPSAVAEVRWPLIRTTRGAAHVLEPIAQVIYTGELGDAVPNEDSQLPEFDETNLFSLNRFPGQDRFETGLRANLGVNYTRYDPTGWSMGLTLGRVLRSEAEDDFAEGTGLAGRWSDYVGAVSLDFGWGLSLVNRALFSDDLTFRRNELALAYDGARGALRAAYVFLAEDDSNPILGPQPETNEFALDARYRVRPNWQVRGLWRYDIAADENLRAGGALTYGNECAEFDLSVSRRYTSSNNVPPSTSVAFSVRLAGLGEGGDWDWPARVCTTRGI
jgi:LPS-assembly protein